MTGPPNNANRDRWRGWRIPRRQPTTRPRPTPDVVDGRAPTGIQAARTRYEVPATLPASAHWRARLLTRQLRCLPLGASYDHLEMLIASRALLLLIENDFKIDADGSLVLTPDRREIEELCERLRATERAVRRAYAIGIESDVIQRASQGSWSLACQLFDALGWAEAFPAQPEHSGSVRKRVAGQRAKPSGNRGRSHLRLVSPGEGGPLPTVLGVPDTRRGEA